METEDLPIQEERRPGQRYVMFFMESPFNYRYDYDRFNRFFNWTMTYRLDSDVPNPYGRVVPKSGGELDSPQLGRWAHTYDPVEFAASNRSEEFRALARRPHAIAWIVSHCDTGRRFNRHNFGLSFGLKNRLRFHFDSD